MLTPRESRLKLRDISTLEWILFGLSAAILLTVVVMARV
jgi:hypothetical protein